MTAIRYLLPPSVCVKTGDLLKMTEKTWEAIGVINEPPTLFIYAGKMALVTHNRHAEPPLISHLDQNSLRCHLLKHINFVDKRGAPARPPVVLIQNLLADFDPPLPELMGITEVPVFSKDGTLHTTPGYNPKTKLYYEPPNAIKKLEISSHPIQEEVSVALDFLCDELLGDFPFESEWDKTRALAALILPFVRPIIAGPTPLHLISKPKAGTGATLLARILCLPVCGEPPVIPVPPDEPERRRTLLSLLRGVPRAVVLDNVSKLEGAALSSCLTQTYYEDRVMGSSNLIRVPNRCVWLATGNNPDSSDEIARRSITIRLDALVEQPELRSVFRYPLLKEWASSMREVLVWAILTLIQAWVAAGMPKSGSVLGGFEEWSQVIGGILDTVGRPGLLEQIREHRTSVDSDTVVFQGFVETWATEYKDHEVTASKLLRLSAELDLGSGDEHSRSIRLGKVLRRRIGQVFGSWMLQCLASTIFPCWRQLFLPTNDNYTLGSSYWIF